MNVLFPWLLFKQSTIIYEKNLPIRYASTLGFFLLQKIGRREFFDCNWNFIQIYTEKIYGKKSQRKKIGNHISVTNRLNGKVAAWANVKWKHQEQNHQEYSLAWPMIGSSKFQYLRPRSKFEFTKLIIERKPSNVDFARALEDACWKGEVEWKG